MNAFSGAAPVVRQVGVVVIGRNEGERLRRCLESVVGRVGAVVYVDSGSSDGSVELARALGVSVVDLDLRQPFTAARARNAGFARLIEVAPETAFVQFVDGDCEVVAGWFGAALEAFSVLPQVSVLAGRLSERFPEKSIYNRLGDLEWNVAGVGEVTAVGGIFMMRRTDFERLGGFDPSVAAGEEPELWHRLASQGGRLWRLDQGMAWHDLAMTRFGQWWRRQSRFGYGALDVTRRFDLPCYRRNILRARFWVLWPLIAVLAGLAGGRLGGPLTGALAALLVLGLWPAQMLRIALRTRRSGHRWSLALAFAFFTQLSYWPQMQGQVRYLSDRRRGVGHRRFDYKSPSGG